MKKTFLSWPNVLIFLLVINTSFSCKVDPVTPATPVITLEQQSISLEFFAASKNIAVTTTLSPITCTSTADDWCTATYNNSTLTVNVLTNDNTADRSAVITLKSGTVTSTLSVSQSGRGKGTSSLNGDTKISATNTTASSTQTGFGIERTQDGSFTTNYYSNASTSAVTMTYNFGGTSNIDFLYYYPRSDGYTYGNFKQFDLYVATASNPTLTKYGTYDFKGNSTMSQITFSPALVNPTQIQFVLQPASGNIISCSEMQFYKKGDSSFDYATIFTDQTCSEIKPTVTLANINAITDQFYKNLALDVFNKTYNSEFRVQSYKAWQHPDIMAAVNKAYPYSLRDNPTGIYATTGETLIVFVGDTHGQNISLFIQNPDTKIVGSSYPLHSGMNKILALNSGLIYVMYHTQTGTEDPVKINFATGSVNGYFDSQKHTQADWQRILNKATFRHFDVLGRYAHLTFETAAFKQYTPDGLALINKYDQIVYAEQDFQGMVKYNKMAKNRLYLLVVYPASDYMYATNYYTAYNATLQSGLLSVGTLVVDPYAWGVAHEIGHVNQVRSTFKWLGMTEVTNNLNSLNIQSLFGNPMRLVSENHYSEATTAIINAKIAHNAAYDTSGKSKHFFWKLVPFWQLKLYMIDVLDKKDFYRDLYEKMRTNPEPSTPGQCQIEFVKAACDVAQLDLTDFFTAWGFLTPIDMQITDYTTAQFTVSQTMIDACKSYITAKGYAKPTKAIQTITDSNIQSFKMSN